jgi:hypothetical protein
MARKKRNDDEIKETPLGTDPELDPEISPWLDRYEQEDRLVPHERLYRFQGPRGEVRLVQVATLYMPPRECGRATLGQKTRFGPSIMSRPGRSRQSESK